MTGRLPDWLPKRPGMLLPVVGVHVGALLLVIGSRTTPIAPTPDARLTVFDVASSSARLAKQPKKTPVDVLVEAPVIATLPPVATPILVAQVAALQVADQAGSRVDCDLTDVVQTAVRESPPARSALLMLPRDARSVANAIMLWDGRWTAGTTTSTQYALGKIREVVTAAVDAASPECRAAVQGGPRLATVSGAPDMVIAFGSGHWRWGDLIAAPALTVAANDIAERGGAPASLAAQPRPN
jgi:hypothetical protein